MQIQIAIAATDVYVDKLPKGAKITNYEIHNPRSNKMLDKGAATTLKQVFKRMDFIVPSGMTVDVTLIAQQDDTVIKVKDSYIMKASGPVKAA